MFVTSSSIQTTISVTECRLVSFLSMSYLKIFFIIFNTFGDKRSNLFVTDVGDYLELVLAEFVGYQEALCIVEDLSVLVKKNKLHG